MGSRKICRRACRERPAALASAVFQRYFGGISPVFQRNFAGTSAVFQRDPAAIPAVLRLKKNAKSCGLFGKSVTASLSLR